MSTTYSPKVRSATRADAVVGLAAELGARQTGGPTRRRTALIGLHCLAAFARKQLDFLQTGLQAGSGAFEADERYPLEFLLEATSRQLSFDADVLLRSIGHRERTASTESMRDTLDLADRLAADAILPAVHHGLVEPTVMLSYFQKSPTIRLMPYVPLAVIGIDFSAAGDRSRLLAIAHETGHHVYRQLTVNYTEHLDAQIDAMAAAAPAATPWPAWLLAWGEEIFADIYAALIAGPAAALGLHQVILTGTRTSLVEDDGDHPLDALRPQIMHTTLRVMAANGPQARSQTLQQAADELDAMWRKHLSDRGAPDEFIPAGQEQPISLADAGAQLNALVVEMLGGAFAPLLVDAAYAPWSTSVAQSDAEIDAAFAALSGAPLPELSLRSESTVVTVVRYPIPAQVLSRTVGETGDAYLDDLRVRGLVGAALRAEEWKAVFLGGDWTTQEGGSGIKPPVFNPGFWWMTTPARQPVRRPVRR